MSYKGRQMLYRTMREALEYIFYQRFIALVKGEKIGCHNDTLYPVDSLLPPVVKKVDYFYDLNKETI